MRKKWNNRGMMALLDAMLFFVIMIITSGLFLQIGIAMSNSAELVRDQRSAEYNDDVRLAWMGSSIPVASYTHLNIPHVRHDQSVQFLILEQFHLIKDEGVNQLKYHHTHPH